MLDLPMAQDLLPIKQQQLLVVQAWHYKVEYKIMPPLIQDHY
jgi:hypothetical protein